MLVNRDHHTGSLFDPWEYLGDKRRTLLEKSWAAVFREYLLAELPVAEIGVHFCDDMGRPTKDFSMVLGALILQQLHDYTDSQTVEVVFHRFCGQVVKPLFDYLLFDFRIVLDSDIRALNVIDTDCTNTRYN